LRHNLRELRYTPRSLVVAAVIALLVVIGSAVAIRGTRPRVQVPPGTSAGQVNAHASGYAEASSCAECHEDIARTYALTGMGRSVTPIRSGAQGLADVSTNNRLHHAASNRYYTMIERDGRLYQRRHEIGFDGNETNVLDVEAHYIIGSGNHARTFVHRGADGRLRQLPVTWYTDRGGYWAMSPGYDRPAHLDFRRLIVEDCMSCHNDYPATVQNDGNGPRFSEPLPSGIGCQRCHGPGQAHVNAARSGDRVAARRTITNPANFDRDRQLETCLQCHLETTSSPLPFQIRRYEQPAFSYTPGKPLADYFIRFDHAPGTGWDDKFGVAGQAYRLRKSACFLQSRMTCGTCHDPHESPRGQAAERHYVSVCQSCHTDVHRAGVPRVSGIASGASGPTPTCLDCHMPKRRTDDVVHVVMTDHYIQRKIAGGTLLAPRTETGFEHSDYRGEVVPYYPATLPSTPENELYVALAQVQQGSNLRAGIQRLEAAIARHKPARADFYYELARAYAKTSNHEAVIRWCDEALGRDSGFAPALKELAGAAIALGRMPQAAGALERAVGIHPKDADALADLGNVYLQQNQLDAAEKALQQALMLDPMLSRANNTRGLTALRKGQAEAAERFFRAAILHQPDLAEAQNNLGNLLAGRKAYAEAAYHFEQATRADPAYAEARHSYGLTLALMQNYPKAITELREAVKLSRQPAAVRVDLGDVLATMGRRGEARREYQRAASETTDPDTRRAALDALGTLRP
jgi:predicted CXXCH cytochrome family protein